MFKRMWVKRQDLENTSRTVNDGGVEIVVHISPAQIPESVRGSYDSDAGLFRIDFEYYDKEPAGRARAIEGLKVVEGKYSGKLLQIWVPVDKLNLAAVSLKAQVVNAMQKRTRELSSKDAIGRQLNQKVAEDVVQSPEFGQLAEGLTGPR